MVEVLRHGYHVPFLSQPHLSPSPISLPSYSPTSIKEKALSTEIQALQEKGSVEQAPPTPGFYSRVFVAMKASGVLRPIIDLSILNLQVAFTKFYMETPVCSEVCSQGGLDGLGGPPGCASAGFRSFGITSLSQVRVPRRDFPVQCPPLGVNYSAQVFTWVLALVSVIMHQMGFCLIHYLDDWLVLDGRGTFSFTYAVFSASGSTLRSRTLFSPRPPPIWACCFSQFL